MARGPICRCSWGQFGTRQAVSTRRQLRALMIVEEQALMSNAEKRNEQYFPPYLEVLQSNVQPSSSSELSELRGEVRKVESKVDAMAADMAAMKAPMGGLASAKK